VCFRAFRRARRVTVRFKVKRRRPFSALAPRDGRKRIKAGLLLGFAAAAAAAVAVGHFPTLSRLPL
jgi:hypothetical protein